MLLRLLGHLNLLIVYHAVRALNVVTEILSLNLLHSALLNGEIVVEIVIPGLGDDLRFLIVSLSRMLVGLHDCVHSQDFEVSILFKGLLV